MEPKKRKLVLMLKSKGGVGASFVARFIAECYRRDGVRALLIDGDASVGELVRFLGTRDAAGKLLMPQPRDGVQYFSFHGAERDRDELLNVLEDAKEDVVLVDLPAAALYALQRAESDAPFLSLVDSLGYAVTVVSLLTPYVASLRDLADVLSYAPKAEHVVIRNLGFGEPEDFTLWDTSKTKKRAAEIRAVVVDLPALRSRIAAAIDASNARFLNGAQVPGLLSVADRGRLMQWIASTEKAFAPALDRLGLGSNSGTLAGTAAGTVAGTA